MYIGALYSKSSGYLMPCIFCHLLKSVRVLPCTFYVFFEDLVEYCKGTTLYSCKNIVIFPKDCKDIYYLVLFKGNVVIFVENCKGTTLYMFQIFWKKS